MGLYPVSAETCSSHTSASARGSAPLKREVPSAVWCSCSPFYAATTRRSSASTAFYRRTLVEKYSAFLRCRCERLSSLLRRCDLECLDLAEQALLECATCDCLSAYRNASERLPVDTGDFGAGCLASACSA